MFNLHPTINYNLNVSLVLLKKELKFIITHFFQKSTEVVVIVVVICRRTHHRHPSPCLPFQQ